MTKSQKIAAVDKIQEMLDSSPVVYLTNYSGLSVEQANDLRGRLRDAGVEFRVLKNTLVRLAMERVGGYEELYDRLEGPTALALSDEPSLPARVFKKFLKDRNVEKPSLKAAYIEGAVYDEDALDILASLKSKDELIGDIVGLILSPIANVLGGLQAPGQTIAGALQTIAEKEQ